MFQPFERVVLDLAFYFIIEDLCSLFLLLIFCSCILYIASLPTDRDPLIPENAFLNDAKQYCSTDKVLSLISLTEIS